MSEERLQKILARAGVAARRKAEDLIREGRVTVNGEPASIGDKADPDRDNIKVDGKRVTLAKEHRYLLLNKPRGVLTAVTDPTGRPTVMELVPPAFRRALVPVGRLDYQTEGLLILTDDGEFAQRLAHPRYGCHKTYEVKVKGTPRDEDLARLRRGIVIEGRRTAPARIRAVRTTPVKGPKGESSGGNTWYEVELSEGRSRQIREMFFRVGHPVQKLRRIAIGPLHDGALPVGALRELTVNEVRTLRKLTAEEKPRVEPERRRSAPARPARDEKAPARPRPDADRKRPGSAPRTAKPARRSKRSER